MQLKSMQFTYLVRGPGPGALRDEDKWWSELWSTYYVLNTVGTVGRAFHALTPQYDD